MTDPQTPTGDFLKLCDEDRDTTNAFRRDLLSRVGDKWSILVIATLASGPIRFTELQRTISGISHRMLSVTLRSLVADGLVLRESFGEVPPRVEYSLTALGETLLSPVVALVNWADEHRDEVETSRQAQGGR